MNRFRYPDVDDLILRSFVDEKEPYRGYWAESEERALERVGEYLAQRLGARADVFALDAGCGRGRALAWITRFAARIVAVDPDPDRLAVARQCDLRNGDQTHIDFLNLSIHELKDASFNFIVCNHVIQHVSTGAARAILSSLRKLAAPGCVALLSLSRSKVGHEYCGVALLKDGKHTFETIDQVTFNSLAERGGSDGCLPVRMIDPERFSEVAHEEGWKSEWHWTYHCGNWGKAVTRLEDDDMLNASPALLRECEGDIYLALRPAD